MPFAERATVQQERLHLPKLPTTTIGSFPQTGDLRKMRRQFEKGSISAEAYEAFIKEQIRQVIDHHYQEGIRLFREERLEDAVAEWRRVLDLEPRHPNARRNIEQAERLLEALERRRTH